MSEKDFEATGAAADGPAEAIAEASAPAPTAPNPADFGARVSAVSHTAVQYDEGNFVVPSTSSAGLPTVPWMEPE